MTTDTPRTDAFWANGNNTGDELDPLCRQLERELLTARDDAFNLANALSKAEAEVERLRAFIKKCLELLDCDLLPTMSTLLNQFLEIYPYLLYLFIRYKKYPHIPCMSNDRSEQRLKN
jgi:hypothetical protein